MENKEIEGLALVATYEAWLYNCAIDIKKQIYTLQEAFAELQKVRKYNLDNQMVKCIDEIDYWNCMLISCMCYEKNHTDINNKDTQDAETERKRTKESYSN